MVSGIWGIGLAHRSVDLERVPMLNEAWVLRSDGEVWESGRLLGKVDSIPQEGDSIVSFLIILDIQTSN